MRQIIIIILNAIVLILFKMIFMNKIFKCRTVPLIFLVAILISCNGNNESAKKEDTPSKSPFVGSWVQPNPINDKEVQGFALEENGSASSINMATLVYKKWWTDSSHKLVLVAESIGNGISFLDTSSYSVVIVNDSALTIKQGDYEDTYVKQESHH
jgi:hypothetical protein